MERYTRSYKATVSGFEKELREAVVVTAEKLENRLFAMDARNLNAPEVLSIFMLVTYPDEMVPPPSIFARLGWGDEPRTEMVHGAIEVTVFPHGQDEVRASIVCRHEHAAEYCALLLAELDGRWQPAQRNEDVGGREQQRRSVPVQARSSPRPEDQTEGKPHARTDAGQVKPEVRRRAELAAAEKEREPTLSYQGAAMRLNRLSAEYRSRGQDLGIGEKEVEADDVRYALRKMRELEPTEPKWRWAKGDASFRR